MLKKLLLLSILLLGYAGLAQSTENPKVLIDTNLGEIELELDVARAPLSVANFLSYVDSGFYDGTVFHRVIPKFMAQGGGFNAQMVQKQGKSPVKNESHNGLANQRGTLAYARTAHPDSATSQFFINLVDNAYLNGDANKPGYTVFGKVVRGMETVDKIAQLSTTTRDGMPDVPQQEVLIRSAKKLKPAANPNRQ